jgi:hypothetical protein
MVNDGRSSRETVEGRLRKLATGALMCGLAGAALAAVHSSEGDQGGAAGRSVLTVFAEDGLAQTLPVPGAMWTAYPLPGMNVGYPKMAPAFESGKFNPGRLRPIDFDTAPDGWNGTLPVEPIRENEVNHPLALNPFERLPAAEQANISAQHALEAAEVAKKAYSGGGEDGEDAQGEEEDAAAGEPASAPPAAATPAAAKAVGGKGMLAALQKSAASLTAKAEAAVNALNQAELKIAQKQKQQTLQQQDTQQQNRKDGTRMADERRPAQQDEAREHTARSSSANSSDQDDSERAALLAAKQEVDDALQRLAHKHQSLHQTERDKRDEREGDREGEDDVQQKMARAQRSIYDRYLDEYQNAVHHTEEQAETTTEFSDAGRKQSLHSADAPVQSLDTRDAKEIARRWKRTSYIATSGPIERATIVKDVPIRNWPLVGQYGHTHAWPYVAMDGDLVVQNEDPVVGPKNCADDPISVDCTGLPSSYAPTVAPHLDTVQMDVSILRLPSCIPPCAPSATSTKTGPRSEACHHTQEDLGGGLKAQAGR